MRRIITFLFILMAIAANARQISPDEAQSIAAEFFGGSPKHVSPKGVKRVAPKDMTADNQPYYVFNAADNAGFVIISGDDRARKILGYSDKGEFDFNNLPPQLDWLLKEYGKQIESIPASASQDPSWLSTDTPAEGEGVLLETANWGQGAPYNAQCPIIDGVQAPTGCVATAMAIVMKYHNWPERGRGVRNCSPGFEQNQSEWIVTDFTTFSFEWENMYNDYSNISNPSDYNAVSTLMYAAGRSVNTVYHPNGSGAQSATVGYSLARYFKYSSEFEHLLSANYTENEWINIIHSEIDNRRPVILSAVGSVGHEFVCDGYKDQYIHINWGWNGDLNGFFSLVSFGVKDYCFSNGMTMDINIEPDFEENEVGDIYIDNGDTSCGVTNPYGAGINLSVTDVEKNVPFNAFIETIQWGNGDMNFDIAIALTDENGNIKQILKQININPSGEYKESSEIVSLWNGTGLNNQNGVKLVVYDLVVSTDLNETDRIQLFTRNNDSSEWIKIIGVACDSYTTIRGNHPNTVTVYYEGNVPIDQLDIRGSRDLSSLFKGQYIQIFIDKGMYGNGEPYITYATINNIITYKENENKIIASFSVSEDAYSIKIERIEESDLKDVEITTTDGGEVEQLLSSEDLCRIGEIRISGLVNSKDLDFLYYRLPVLRTLNLSNAKLTEKHDHDNLLWFGVANGQIGQIKTLHLPANSKEIPDVTFAYFEPLQNLYLPSTVEFIGEAVFQGANSLKNIILRNPIPCELTSNAFVNDEYYYSNIALWVPVGAKPAYECDEVWGKFKHIYEGEPLAIIDFYNQGVHYYGATDEISVIGKMFIDPNKENQWNQWQNVTILDNYEVGDRIIPITKICSHAFGSNDLASIVIGNNIREIGNGAFAFLDNIEIDFGNGIRELKNTIFNYCSFKSIRFGHNITNIEPGLIDLSSGTSKSINIYLDCTAKIEWDTVFKPGATSVSFFYPFVEPLFESMLNTADLYVPGQCSHFIESFVKTTPTEMWSYDIDRNHNLIKIEPAIDGIEITSVLVNGETVSPTSGCYYENTPSESLDVVVNYTLHNRQAMTTHYDAEFNAQIPDTELSLPVSVASIEITPASVQGEVGAEYQLTAMVMPENATNKAVEWSSDNTEVAAVDANGLLSLLAQGTATITATAVDGSGVQAQCTVIVDTQTGIENVLINADTEVKIYSTTGVLLFEGRYSDAKLDEGIYVVVTRDNRFKRLIK